MEVFQGWLDRVARSFFDDDFDTYSAAHHCPFVLVTAGATLIVATQAELRQGFEEFRDMLQAQGTTQLERIGFDVLQISPSLRVGRYENHYLRGSTRLFEPYISTLTLRFSGGAWRAACITNPMTNDRWPIHMPRFEHGGPQST